MNGIIYRRRNWSQRLADTNLQFAMFNEQWEQVSEIPVDLKVCECCPTGATQLPLGAAVVVRDRGAERASASPESAPLWWCCGLGGTDP